MTLFIDVSIVFFSFSFQDLLAFVKIKILKYYELVAKCAWFKLVVELESWKKKCAK